MVGRPRRRQFSLAGLLGLVALSAIGFGALRAETDTAQAVLLTLPLCGMLLAVRLIVSP